MKEKRAIFWDEDSLAWIAHLNGLVDTYCFGARFNTLTKSGVEITFIKSTRILQGFENALVSRVVMVDDEYRVDQLSGRLRHRNRAFSSDTMNKVVGVNYRELVIYEPLGFENIYSTQNPSPDVLNNFYGFLLSNLDFNDPTTEKRYKPSS